MGKQLALAVVLAVVSSNAAARWVAVGSSDDMTFYADPATITRTGPIVQIVTLIDSKTAREGLAKPYRSARGQQEYDCEKVRERSVAVTYYSGNMAGGEIVGTSSDSGAWEAIPPDTKAEDIWKIVCSKP